MNTDNINAHIDSQSADSDDNRYGTLKIVCIAFGIIALAIALTKINNSNKTEPTFKEPVPLEVTVNTINVTADSHAPILKSTASVQAWQESELAVQVGGRLEWLCACLETGTEVTQGTVLAKIESVDYRVNVAQAKQAMADARQRIAEEQARSEQARADWTELNLGEPTDLALRKPQLDAANATLERRTLELQQAKRNLSRTQIKAPYDGIITSRNTNVGNFLTTGSSIGTILNTDKVQVNFALSADDVNKLDTEKTAIQIFDTKNLSDSWQAEIVRVDSVIDSRTRLVNVIAEIKNPFAQDEQKTPLRVGTFVSTEFPGKTRTNIYALPSSSVLSNNTVYIVNQDNAVEILTAQIVHRNPDKVLVTFENSATSLNVITSGQAALTDSLKVIAVNQ